MITVNRRGALAPPYARNTTCGREEPENHLAVRLIGRRWLLAVKQLSMNSACICRLRPPPHLCSPGPVSVPEPMGTAVEFALRSGGAYAHVAALGEHMRTSLNQLMRIALLLTAIDAALAVFPATAHAGSGPHRPVDVGAARARNGAVLINIDKTNQRMTVFLNGVETYEWPVSTGRAGYSTPSGAFTATSMNKIWYSKQWDNAPMPHSIFFIKDGHAIHGSFDVKNLGQPVSHGCVRISPKNAAILYALVEKNGLENTQVVVTGVSPGGEYNVTKRQTSPQEGFFEDSLGVPYPSRSQGYDRSPWTYSPW